MTPNLTRRRTERRGLRMWPVGTVLTLTFVIAIAVTATVFFAGWDLLGAQGLKPERRLTSQTLFDLVKLSFGVVAGAGALVALVVAYRRQRVDEDGALRDTTRLHTERFTTAVSQLGNESAAVRLGGVYALAGLADDAPTRTLRQTAIDVRCAYLRLPYTAEADLPPGDTHARHEYLARRQVRHTVIRLIRDHLRLAPEHPHSWQGHDLNFTSVVFDGGDFSRAVFSGGFVDFTGAVFSGGAVSFLKAVFSRGAVSFTGAEFSGGTVDFTFAEFSGGVVTFTEARFTGGTVDFPHAGFTGGEVHFDNAQFSGGTVGFGYAKFTGGTVDFGNAGFTGGEVHFGNAAFDGGTVSFFSAGFSGGTVHFGSANFHGGTAHFTEATFSGGTVHFGNAKFFGGTVDFGNAGFTGGTVHFTGTEFFGGNVDFSRANGVAPSGLVPSVGQSLPTGLSLPQAWHPPTHA